MLFSGFTFLHWQIEPRRKKQLRLSIVRGPVHGQPAIRVNFLVFFLIVLVVSMF